MQKVVHAALVLALLAFPGKEQAPKPNGHNAMRLMVDHPTIYLEYERETDGTKLSGRAAQ